MQSIAAHSKLDKGILTHRSYMLTVVAASEVAMQAEADAKNRLRTELAGRPGAGRPALPCCLHSTFLTLCVHNAITVAEATAYQHKWTHQNPCMATWLFH